MIMPMLSGGSTLSMVLVILVMTSMAGNIFSHVTTLKSCLDSFRNKRSDEYSFNHLFQRDYCNNILNLAQFVKVTKPEIGPDGYTEVALDYLDNNDDKLRSGIMEKIVKQLDAPCVPLLSMIILQLEKVNTITRESKLRKKVNELGDSLQLIELDDDYYPYCQLMTFTQSYGFIQWFMRKLKYKDDDIILANDHRGLLGTEAPFRELFDKLVPAYFSLNRKQLRLVRIFSDAVRPVRTKLGDEYVLESFQLGFRPLLDFKGFNRGWYWKQSNPVEVRSSLGSKFGLQATKESIPKIIRLVGHRFLPACRAFLKAFKDVFDEEYMRKNATRFKHAVWQYGHTWGLLGLIHIWGIYHDCYFLVNDRDGAFIDMLRREGDEKKANQEGDNSSSFAAGKLEQNSSENE